MESTKTEGYVPSPECRAMIVKHLGDAAILDAGYNKNITLKKSEAERRCELVSEIEYDFQLALNKGQFYMGKAVINFYVKEMPKEGELWLDF